MEYLHSTSSASSKQGLISRSNKKEKELTSKTNAEYTNKTLKIIIITKEEYIE